MNGELITTAGGSVAELRPARNTPASQNPALVYLAGLASGSRRTMRQALDVIAGELTGRTCNAETCPWGTLRFQHTATIRAWLAERYAPATANKMLAALRGVFKAAWRLGQMTAEDYTRGLAIWTPCAVGTPQGAGVDFRRKARPVRGLCG